MINAKEMFKLKSLDGGMVRGELITDIKLLCEKHGIDAYVFTMITSQKVDGKKERRVSMTTTANSRDRYLDRIAVEVMEMVEKAFDEGITVKDDDTERE